MLGLNFSDFSWWIWLLIGVGAFIVTIVVLDVSCRGKHETMKVLVSVVFGLAGLVCIAIGFRDFIRWASGG
jgi:uncharacterized membrane protein YuzA (DUF378 family)